jgi:hypothetical protein
MTIIQKIEKENKVASEKDLRRIFEEQNQGFYDFTRSKYGVSYINSDTVKAWNFYK